VGELAAEYINPNADPALKEQTLAFAKTMAAVAGVIVGGGGKNAADVNVAATAGANAAENNHMLHPPETRLAKRLAASATIRKPDGTAYTAEEVMEQLRLMGNKVTKQTPNTATALIGSEAIVNSVKEDPSLPKAIDGNVAVEKLGKPNAALQRYIIENTEGALGWLPDTSPYVASVPLDKPTTQKRPVNVTASCANGDTACITGIGQQQNAPLTQQARGAIADGASGLSRQAGVVAATATTVTTVAPPQVKPVSGAVAVGATVIGVGADAVEQLMRPDTGQTTVNLLGTVTGEAVNKVLPIAAPLTNEIVEGLKGSDKADQIKKETNSFIEWLSK
jgi:filamentous hemagglutinin